MGVGLLPGSSHVGKAAQIVESLCPSMDGRPPHVVVRLVPSHYTRHVFDRALDVENEVKPPVSEQGGGNMAPKHPSTQDVKHGSRGQHVWSSKRLIYRTRC